MNFCRKMSSTFGSSFGGAAKGNNGRFSLLLLDENEYFFEDHSAVYYHPRPNQRGMSIQQRQATPVGIVVLSLVVISTANGPLLCS